MQRQSQKKYSVVADSGLKHNVQGIKMGRKMVLLTLSGALLLGPLTGPTAPWGAAHVSASSAAQAAVPAPKLTLQKEEMVTAGVKRLDYLWTKTSATSTVQSNVHVIEVDLTNPHVRLDVMSGKNNTVANKNTTLNMVKETGAVAGINADFFTMANEGVPMGPQITSGSLVSSPSVLKGMYSFALSTEKVPVIDAFGFEGKIAVNGQEFPLTGINQSNYTMEQGDGTQKLSHLNAMYIYTHAWTAAERPNTSKSATTPTEVLVQDGVVMQIADNATLPMRAPENGYILRTHGDAAKFAREHLTVGQRVTAQYNLVSLTSGAKKNPSSYQMMVGGHTLLVDEGKASAFTRDIAGVSGSSRASRTAIGYSRDSKKVYMITTERNGGSSGMTLTELQQAMVSLGVWKGLNLDGGGSTTMVDRALGEFDAKLAHVTQEGSQRAVTNGIGIYTSAPQGKVLGIKASGKNVLFIGEQATYALKAYDTFYNPLDPAGMTAQWSMEHNLGKLENGVLTPAKSGKSMITVKSGIASDQIPVEVIGQEQIMSMTIGNKVTSLQEGAQIALPVTVLLEDGRELKVPASALKWELQGFIGSVQGEQLAVEQLKPGITTAYAIARYEGYSAIAVFSSGGTVTEKLWETFENVTYPITFNPQPEQTVGAAAVVSGLAGRETSKALRITYDFTNGSGNRYAYAELNGGNGIVLEGQPVAMSAMVYGDNSNNWVRAEARDANNKPVYIDLARPTSWTGWQAVKGTITGDIAYPLTLKRIYVANPESGQSGRALTGEVAIDDIKLEYTTAVEQQEAPKIVLTVGKKEATINGEKLQLDVAPLVLQGTTYLPLKFVAEAIEGQVAWENTSKRATFIRGSRMIDLWLGRTDIVVNGVRLEAPVAPILRDGRTLVPLRLVSEQLGLKVGWENAAKRITIQ